MSSYIITLPDGSKNTIRADAEFVEKHYPGAQLVPEPEATEPQPAFYTKMTRLAFRSRFSGDEKRGIKLASVINPAAAPQDQAMAADISNYMDDVRDAEHIDPQDPKTRGGLLLLEAIGLLDHGRALEILDAPIQPGEAPL